MGAFIILVVMEDGLGHIKVDVLITITEVLILVVMEYGLGRLSEIVISSCAPPSLNPCFSGRWSLTH